MSSIPARSTRVFAGSIGPFLGLGLALLLGSQMLTSCGSDDDSSCVPNAQQPCFATNCPSNEGVQVCNADGSAFSACSCDGTGNAGNGGAAGSSSSGGGSSGAAGAGGAPVVSDERGIVGAPCETAGNCAAGLDCVPSTAVGPFQQGGPAGGYCTTTCTDTSDCQAIDALSGCALDGGTETEDTSDDASYCIALCQTGSPDPNEFKCQAVANATRADLACFPASNMAAAGRALGLCYPICQTDASCGDGRFCDLSTGICIDEQPPAANIGAACEVDEDCPTGLCVTIGGSSFCSAFCTFGSIGGCGFDAELPEGERGAACLDAGFAGGGLGDVGFCSQLCDTAADCAQADYDCTDLTELFADPQIQTVFGRTGFCNPPGLAGGGDDAGAP